MSTPIAAAAELELEPRKRLGKLCGMLGSAFGGERANALAAIDKGLAEAGHSWRWVGELVAQGELPGGEREKLLGRLLADRLREALIKAWAMSREDAMFVRGVLERCAGDLSGTSCAEMVRAIAIADEARRRAR